MYKALKSEFEEGTSDAPVTTNTEVKIPEKIITIGDKRYEIKFLPASDGITMAKELVKLLTPVLGSLVDGTREAAQFGDARVFSDAAVYFCANLDKADVLSMMKALLADLKVNGKDADFDTTFSANYGDLVEVVKFAMEGNFSSFFTSGALKQTLAGLLTLLSKAQAEAPVEEQ